MIQMIFCPYKFLDGGVNFLLHWRMFQLCLGDGNIESPASTAAAQRD